MRILLNGIPASGKSTIAYKLHLKLEHSGYETILLDDEVIKRLDPDKIQTLIDYIDAPITIIVSCNPEIQADHIYWVNTDIEEAQRRDVKRLKDEGAPGDSDFSSWVNYQSKGKKINNWEEIWQDLELNKKS